MAGEEFLAMDSDAFGPYADEECQDPLPIHRTEAGWPRCATCDGGVCPDCTDPAS